MDQQNNIIESAKKALIYVLNFKKDENVLIINDEKTKTISEIFKSAAKELGAVVETFVIPENQRPLSNIPEEMIELLKGKSVVFNIFRGDARETPFRIKWCQEVTKDKLIRLAHCPGITEQMFINGPMNVDYKAMVNLAKSLIEKLKDAKKVHITAPSGTDITIDIENRRFESDILITEDNWGNLPCGEICCAPVEDGANGVIVCDGSIGDLGQVTSPLKITVQNGKILEIESQDKKLETKVKELSSIDEYASIIGELGIGVNPAARLTGNLLEDEKAYKTIHIAFGNNFFMSGGQNRSATHRDYLINLPTLTVTYKNNNKLAIMKQGEFVNIDV